MFPPLPDELVIDIFKKAARSSRSVAIALLQVSKWVKEIVEPLLGIHDVVILCEEDANKLLSTIWRYPGITRHIRNLRIPRSQLQQEAVVGPRTRYQDISVSQTSARYLRMYCKEHLENVTLHCDFLQLATGSPLPLPPFVTITGTQQVSFSQPPSTFSQVTHLRISALHISFNDSVKICTCMPFLTHLAYQVGVEAPIAKLTVDKFLEEGKRLERLVVVVAASPRKTRDLCEAFEEIGDKRFVFVRADRVVMKELCDEERDQGEIWKRMK